MTNKNLIDPLMPAQEMRLHMGEMTAKELRTARAAIAWANSAAAALIEQEEAVIASLVGALEQIAFSGITDRDKLTASAVDYIDGGGKYPNERTVAAYALLSAKTHLGE